MTSPSPARSTSIEAQGASWVRSGLTRLRRLAERLGRRESPPPFVFPRERPVARGEAVEALPPDPTTVLIAEIEACALDIYVTHGLPTRAGHYSRGPRGKTWKFIGENLTSQERWAIALEKGSIKGWKFKSLEDLGAADAQGSTELSRASDMLRTCRALRQDLRMDVMSARSDLIRQAIGLGANWQYLRLVTDRRNSGGLRLSIGSARKVARRQKTGA